MTARESRKAARQADADGVQIEAAAAFWREQLKVVDAACLSRVSAEVLALVLVAALRRRCLTCGAVNEDDEAYGLVKDVIVAVRGERPPSSCGAVGLRPSRERRTR